MKKTFKGMVCLLVVGAVSLVGYAADEANNPGSLSKKDYDFVKTAACGGMSEVQGGQLAKTKGMNPSVKQFGQQMVDDHGKANAELKALAQQKGAELPAAPSAKEQKSLDKLSGLVSDDFDRAYTKEMVADHKKDIKEFQWAADKATDPDIRAFAAKTLPTLEMHLNMATNMQSTVTMK